MYRSLLSIVGISVAVLAAGCAPEEGLDNDSLAGEENTAEAESALSCQFKVIWSVAGVYEKPSNSSTKLKTK